ncbi:hypothetical protein RUM44_010947 [Polyplax serrata]
MQNLSISCAMVCLIILGSSALIGLFGITKHQISAVLVTGVMYLLAAIFATFSLTIINFKRSQSRGDCFHVNTTLELSSQGIAVSKTALEKFYNLKKMNKYFDARIISTGWSLHMGWGGTGMCILVSILWILLSKIMRYNPINLLLAML